MSKATIYHNPRCSKSRQTRSLLEENGYEIEEIRYLETPPSKQQLAEFCSKMDKTPLEIMRVKEALFKELGLSVKDERSDDEWFEIMVSNPKLIERPIVVIEQRVAMGRPPENIKSIF